VKVKDTNAMSDNGDSGPDSALIIRVDRLEPVNIENLRPIEPLS